MRIGAFEVGEPLPELRSPRLLTALQPWVDVGSVGTMSLAFLEQSWNAEFVAQLARPGDFYDFTRYRPMLYREGGERHVTIPNTFIRYARGAGERDWLFMHALEPHARGEDFVDSLLEVMSRFGVTEYALVGSMYAPVPHTRPPLASGGSTNPEIMERLRSIGVRESSYEGPTTILALLGTRAPLVNIDTAGLILQLPAYAQIERDYCGFQSMLGLLSRLYGLDLDLSDLQEQIDRQTAAVERSIQEDPRLQTWVSELETLYDSAAAATSPEEDATPLSPELERFLHDVERRMEP